MATSQLADSVRSLLRLRGNPVFLYHGLTNGVAQTCSRRERKYWVSVCQFREHLASFRAKARRVVSLGELWSSSERSKHGTPPIVITFDDGRCSDYEIAFPLLVEAGLRADFFVNTATVETKGYLSWKQIREMLRAGMSFQSHSHDHVNLTQLPLVEMGRQLNLSKSLLEDRLGSKVDFLAVPYGQVSSEVDDTAARAGYRAVCTSGSWPTRPGGRRVHRVVIFAHTSPCAFRALLAGSVFRYATRSVRASMLLIPKRVISPFWQPSERAMGLKRAI